MKQQPPTFATAAHAFLNALSRYQSATLEMNVARQKLNASLVSFSRPLATVVLRTGSAVGAVRQQ